MREIIIEVPDGFGKTLQPERVNSDIKGELVRCKDCRWGDWSRNGKDEEMILCYNGDTGIEDGYLHEPDWFCAEGERKEKGE